MSLLQGIGAANALIRGAAGFVRELKAPSQQDQEFGALLKGLLSRTPEAQAQREAAKEAALTQMAAEVMQLRDVNGDGLLSRSESGLKGDAFTRADLDGDGMLSAKEVRQAMLQATDRFAGTGD